VKGIEDWVQGPYTGIVFAGVVFAPRSHAQLQATNEATALNLAL